MTAQAPLLRGRRSELRPIEERHYPWLFQLLCTGDSLSTFRYRGQVPPPELFPEQLHRDVLTQMVICGNSGQPVGLVQCYQADLRNRNARLALALSEDASGAGWPYEAVMLFINFVFQNWPLRRLYIEGPEPNLTPLRSTLDRLFVEEGRLRQAEYFLGRWVDRLIWTMTVESFSKKAMGLLRNLGQESRSSELHGDWHQLPEPADMVVNVDRTHFGGE